MVALGLQHFTDRNSFNEQKNWHFGFPSSTGVGGFKKPVLMIAVKIPEESYCNINTIPFTFQQKMIRQGSHWYYE